MGVLATFLFVVTFFTACFTLDQSRIEQNRNGIIPCIKYKQYEKNSCSTRQYGKTLLKLSYEKIILTIPGKVFNNFIIELTLLFTICHILDHRNSYINNCNWLSN